MSSYPIHSGKKTISQTIFPNHTIEKSNSSYISLFHSPAENSSIEPQAKFYTAQRSLSGQNGYVENPTEAIKVLTELPDHPESKYTLGLYYLTLYASEKNDLYFVEAIKWLQEASAADHLLASFELIRIEHDHLIANSREMKKDLFLEKISSLKTKIQPLAELNSCQALSLLGQIEEKLGNTKEAIIAYSRGVKRSSADCMCLLALLYSRELQIISNNKDNDNYKRKEIINCVENLLLKASMLGSVNAMFELSLFRLKQIEDEKNTDLKVFLKEDYNVMLSRAAGLNHSVACFTLANNFLNGIMVAKNEKLGNEYLKKAANLGHSKAKLLLGWLIVNTQSSEKELKKGFQLIEELAKHGNLEAIEKLATCYKKGLGVSENQLRAIALLENVVHNNHEGCLNLLIAIYHELYLDCRKKNSSDGNQYLDRCIELLKISIKLFNNPDREHQLGVIYFNYKRNPLEAFKHFKSATNKNYAPSFYNYALCLLIEAASKKEIESGLNLLFDLAIYNDEKYLDLVLMLIKNKGKTFDKIVKTIFYGKIQTIYSSSIDHWFENNQSEHLSKVTCKKRAKDIIDACKQQGFGISKNKKK